MMLYIAVLLLFALATISLYALIKTKHNPVIMLFLIPALLVSTLYSGWAIFALQGSPKKGIPEGEISLLWVQVLKPSIYFTVREKDSTVPSYWVIPYTKTNARKMNSLGKQAEQQAKMGQDLKGQFKLKYNDDSNSDEIHFDKIKREPLPPKKETTNHGVDPGIVNRSQRDMIP